MNALASFPTWRRSALLTAICLGTAILLYLLAATALSLAIQGRDIEAREFDSATWIAHGGSRGSDTRLSMYEDAAKELTGLSAPEIELQLGKPNEIADGDWWYLMGSEPGAFAIDDAWLVVDWSTGVAVVSYATD